jgi:hypothetical protein
LSGSSNAHINHRAINACAGSETVMTETTPAREPLRPRGALKQFLGTSAVASVLITAGTLVAVAVEITAPPPSRPTPAAIEATLLRNRLMQDRSGPGWEMIASMTDAVRSLCGSKTMSSGDAETPSVPGASCALFRPLFTSEPR